MIESLLGPSIGSLTADLNGQDWPTMPPIFTWIYQHVKLKFVELIFAN